MLNKKLMMLAIILVSLLAVSAVNAVDNVTCDVVGVEETSDEVVSVEEDSVINQTDVDDAIGVDAGTFTALQNKIKNAKEGSTITLENDYSYDEGFDVGGIGISKSLTIDGNGHTLNGLHRSQIIRVSSSDVVIKNVNFINATGKQGTAIQWYGDNGRITDCIFENNNAGSNGGAVYWNNTNGIIDGCKFINNSGFLGGAIYLSGENSQILNCIFDYNTGTLAGACYVEARSSTLSNSSFKNGYAFKGGAVVWWTDAGLIKDSIFTGNAAGYGAGAVYIVNNGNEQNMVVNCDFEDNAAGNLSGAVLLLGNATVEDCRFVKNTANETGGAIIFENDLSGGNNYINVINNKFTDNYALEGGAVCSDCDNLVIHDSIFKTNNAWSGGAIYCRGGDLFIHGSAFNNNNASYGGAIYSQGDSELNGCNLTLNTAGNGGAIYSVYHFELNGCSLTSNAADNGGAVYASDCGLKIINSEATNNHASNGGAIYAEGSPVEIENSRFVNNVASGNGGAVISYGSKFSADYSSFINNSANSGGALYLEGATKWGSEINSYIRYSNFVLNDASGYGGAIFNERDLTVISSEFDSNYADYGGAISTYNGVVVNRDFSAGGQNHYEQNYRIILMGENIFRNNRASYGGAISIGYDERALERGLYGRLEIYGEEQVSLSENVLGGGLPEGVTQFLNNTAFMGGALSLAHTNSTMDYARFIENSAAIGGAMNILGYSTTEVNFGKFVDNAANEIGGTIVAQNNLKVVNSDFANSLNQEVIYYSNMSNINLGDLYLKGNTIKTNNSYAIRYESAAVISSPISLKLESQTALKDTRIKIGKLIDDMGNVIVGPGIIIKIPKNQTLLSKGDVLGGNIEDLDKDYLKIALASNYTIGGYSYLCNLSQGVYNIQGFVSTADVKDCTNIDCVLTVSDLVFSAPNVNKYFGGDEKFTVKVSDNKGKAIAGREVSITINDVTSKVKTASNGIASVDLNLNVGNYDVAVSSDGINLASKVSVLSTIVIEDASGSYSNAKVSAKFLNKNGKALANTKVTFKVGPKAYAATTDSSGVASANVDLNAGSYDVVAVNPVTKEEKSAKLTISKASSQISLAHSTNNGAVTVTATLTTGATGKVIFNFNGKASEVAISNGKSIFTLYNLESGNYAVAARYNGDVNFNAAGEKSITFNVKQTPVLTVNNLNKVYGTSNQLTMMLTDKYGAPISNANLQVLLNGVRKSVTTDGQGKAAIPVNLASKTYDATVSFAGNGKYDPVSKTVKVTVNKANPKMTAKAKTFKKSVKTKKYTITLKNNLNKAMKNTKVTIKVNKKTYTAKTNGNGKATFKITKLNKKGKYTATITYKGNQNYNKLTKKVKITVK